MQVTNIVHHFTQLLTARYTNIANMGWGILSKNTHTILYIACTYKFVYLYIISNKNTKNIYYKVFETVFKILNQMKYVGYNICTYSFFLFFFDNYMYLFHVIYILSWILLCMWAKKFGNSDGIRWQ